MIAVRVPNDRNNGRARIQRLDQTGHKVRRPRPQRGIHQPDTVRDLGIGIRREHRTAFIIDQVVVQPQPPRRIIERQQLEPAHTEHRTGIMGQQHAGDGFATGDFNIAHLPIVSFAAVTIICSVTRILSSRLGA